MNATEFANLCYKQKETQLDIYINKADTEVGSLREKLNLSDKQQEILYKLLDTALTDTYVNLLYALDGETSLGNNQQEVFKLYSEDGSLISDCGDLEAAGYVAFHGNKQTE